MNRDSLLEKLTALDFMAVDLQLFLNTHPKCQEAINLYNEIIKEADSVRCQYEKMYGPLCSFRSLSKKDWCWIDKPWPWNESFNYVLSGEERY